MPKRSHQSPPKTVRLSTVLWLLIPVVLSPLGLAHAYLDAGTGSYIVQVTVGVIFGATYTIKNFSGKIIQYFKDKRAKKLDDK